MSLFSVLAAVIKHVMDISILVLYIFISHATVVLNKQKDLAKTTTQQRISMKVKEHTSLFMFRSQQVSRAQTQNTKVHS